MLKLFAKTVILLAEFSKFDFTFGDLIKEISALAKDSCVIGGDPETGTAAHRSTPLTDPVVNRELGDFKFLRSVGDSATTMFHVIVVYPIEDVRFFR